MKVKWNKEKLVKAAYALGLPLSKVLDPNVTRALKKTPHPKNVLRVSKLLNIPGDELIIVE